MSPLRILVCVSLLVLVGCSSADETSDEGSSSSELGGAEESAAAEGTSRGGSNKPVQPRTPVERAELSIVPQDMMTPGDPSPWRGTPPR